MERCKITAVSLRVRRSSLLYVEQTSLALTECCPVQQVSWFCKAQPRDSSAVFLVSVAQGLLQFAEICSCPSALPKIAFQVKASQARDQNAAAARGVACEALGSSSEVETISYHLTYKVLPASSYALLQLM